MGIFFKRYKVNAVLKLVGGDTCNGRIDIGGTILSDISTIEQTIIDIAEKQMGERVSELISYKMCEV